MKAKAHICARRVAERSLWISIALLFSSISAGEEIIVDNRDASTLSSGNWRISNGDNPYWGESIYSNRAGQFSWFFNLSFPGPYDVYAWWTYHPNHSTSVPYTIHTMSEDFEVLVNQQDLTLGGRWILLGRFTFDTRFGNEFSISVSSRNGQASADAIRLVTVEAEGWPADICPCDEYFHRAVEKYLGWGGTLIPPGYEGGATSALCDDPANTLDLDTRFTTMVPGGQVTLNFNAFIHHDGIGDCSARASASFAPELEYYRESGNLNSTTIGFCRASVHDFCKVD